MDFYCNMCEKNYSSYKSLWNHNNTFHKNNSAKMTPKLRQNDAKTARKSINHDYLCSFCDKNFSRKDSLTKHINLNRCKKKDEKIQKIDELTNKVIQLEKLIKTTNKSSNMRNINNTNNGNINNGSGNIINNHIHINALGYESINDKLTEKEKIDLLTSPLFKEIPHIELIRKIYNNEKFLEDRNTMITNLQNKSCLVYNGETKKFEAKNKSDHIDSLIDYRQKDIKDLFEGMQDNKKMKNNAKKLIEDYIDQFDNLKNTESYKKYKEEIIYIIYNCKEIMKKLKDDLENNEDETITI
jgi:hypothetical protein